LSFRYAYQHTHSIFSCSSAGGGIHLSRRTRLPSRVRISPATFPPLFNVAEQIPSERLRLIHSFSVDSLPGLTLDPPPTPIVFKDPLCRGWDLRLFSPSWERYFTLVTSRILFSSEPRYFSLLRDLVPCFVLRFSPSPLKSSCLNCYSVLGQQGTSFQPD